MNVDLMKILKKCKKCDKKLTVAEVADVAQNSFALLYHEGTALKRIEKRLGEKRLEYLGNKYYRHFP